jgi:predicted nucleic acid-binding protein
VKAITVEQRTDAARSLMASQRQLMAPDLMPIELGNVLWKKVQRGAMTPEEAMEAQRGIAALAPVRILSSAAYQPRALALALRYSRSFYDSLYLALAETEGGVFVTADERLVNALRGTGLAPFVGWIGASYD